MNFLIYDTNLTTWNTLFSMIENLPIKILAEKVSSFNSFLKKYTSDKYDVIFIDYNKIGIEILHHIHSKNKQQNIVLLNDTFKCFNDFNCIQCKATFKTTILIKPFTQNHIINIILNHFDCEFVNKNEQNFLIEKIKNEVSLKYEDICFNYEYNEFRLDKVPNNFRITALIYITDLLSKNTIKYETYEENITVQV